MMSKVWPILITALIALATMAIVMRVKFLHNIVSPHTSHAVPGGG